MATHQKRQYCDYCQKERRFTKETFSGGWGCLLTILTGGLFIPIWLLIGFCNGVTRHRCFSCGRKA